MPFKRRDFEAELENRFATARAAGRQFIEINSGELHRAMGDYPNPTLHRMPTLCGVMLRTRREGDEIIERPDNDKLQGPSLTIRYRLSNKGPTPSPRSA